MSVNIKEIKNQTLIEVNPGNVKSGYIFEYDLNIYVALYWECDILHALNLRYNVINRFSSKAGTKVFEVELLTIEYKRV